MATVNFKRQWADGPMPLIESPLRKIMAEGKTLKFGSATAVANEMSNIHNVMIRNINCLLLQAPYVTTPQDQTDLTRFAYAICLFIHEHHQVEETFAFPLIEQAAGELDIMEKNIVQHEIFSPGLHQFETYVRRLMLNVATWDAKKFVRLVESFASTLTSHLTDEINTLLDLEKFNINWEPLLKKISEHAIANVEKYHAIPLFMQSMDLTYEGGIQVTDGGWPPLPWFPQLMFRWLYVPTHKGAWRFACCDPHGKPKELPFAPLKVAATNGST